MHDLLRESDYSHSMRFCPEISDYKQFYATGLGRKVRAAILRRVLAHWPDMSGDTLLGIGYATPYLKTFLRQPKAEVINFMGREQGAVYWPRNRANRCAMVEHTQLPLRDSQINRVLIAHGLEYSDDPHAMLQEIWRVLTPGGRALLVVPNRQSHWARSDVSPFAHGYPYRPKQLRELTEEVGFTTIHTDAAVFFPSWKWRGFLRIMPYLEAAGRLFHTRFGGVIILHIEKQLYAPARPGNKVKLLKGVYAGASKPAMTRNQY